MSELYKRVVEYTLLIEEQLRKFNDTESKTVDALLEEAVKQNYPDELRKIMLGIGQIFRCINTAPRKIESVPEIPTIMCPKTEVYHIYRPKIYVEMIVDRLRNEKALFGFNIQMRTIDDKERDWKITISW